MKIGNKSDCLNEQKFVGSDGLMEASNLLYQLLNASYMCSGTPLETVINGQREDIRSLYGKCKDKMQRTLSGGEKTEFLAMSILEDTFQKAYPLLLINVKDLVEGNMEQVNVAKRLIELFKENPYAKEWNEKAEKYRSLIEMLGFHVDSNDYTDLTSIMDPLLDAFTFYQGGKYSGPPDIYRFSSGRQSNMKPQIMTDVCLFHSEKEIVDAMSSSGRESLIAFCAMEKTNRQVKDYFYEWFCGYADERQRNTIRNNNWTVEEYMEGPAEFTRTVYLCVKSADTIWLTPMPYKNNGYKNFDDQSSKYYYGDRAGYAPYEVFYKDTLPGDKDTTFLTIPKKGYPLSSIMDEMQKIWLPAFLDETIHMFFDNTPAATDMYLPEETKIVIHKKEDNSIAGTIIPMGGTLPSSEAYTLEAISPEELFQDRLYLITLMNRFGINTESLIGVPILPVNCATMEDREKKIRDNTKKAYIKALADKIAEYMTVRWDIRDWVIDSVYSRKSSILTAVAEGALDTFTTTIIDGMPILDDDGNQLYATSDRWPYRKEPKKMQTSNADREVFCYSDLKRKMVPLTLWLGPSTASKPPVVLKIRPASRKDYLALFKACDVPEPEFFQLVDELTQFYKEFSDILKGNIVNQYGALSYYNREDRKLKSIFVPRFADLNICMSKTSYKTMMKGRNNKVK